MHYRSSSEEHELDMVSSHDNRLAVGDESHFGCILEVVFAHRLVVSHDQAVQQHTRVPE
jgi:hypothetical protein